MGFATSQGTSLLVGVLAALGSELLRAQQIPPFLGEFATNSIFLLLCIVRELRALFATNSIFLLLRIVRELRALLPASCSLLKLMFLQLENGKTEDTVNDGIMQLEQWLPSRLEIAECVHLLFPANILLFPTK